MNNLTKNEEIKENYLDQLIEMREEIERTIKKVNNVELNEEYFLIRLYTILKNVPNDLDCFSTNLKQEIDIDPNFFGNS